VGQETFRHQKGEEGERLAWNITGRQAGVLLFSRKAHKRKMQGKDVTKRYWELSEREKKGGLDDLTPRGEKGEFDGAGERKGQDRSLGKRGKLRRTFSRTRIKAR